MCRRLIGVIGGHHKLTWSRLYTSQKNCSFSPQNNIKIDDSWRSASWRALSERLTWQVFIRSVSARVTGHAHLTEVIFNLVLYMKRAIPPNLAGSPCQVTWANYIYFPIKPGISYWCTTFDFMTYTLETRIRNNPSSAQSAIIII